MSEVGDGHTFTGVTGLTVLLWFGSQEVPRVLEFMPSEPESPFYFKAVIRDEAKNVYIQDILCTSFKYNNKEMEKAILVRRRISSHIFEEQ